MLSLLKLNNHHVMQENEPEEYINEVSLDSDEQAEAGPPPYESVMMSGYDGVWLSTNKLTFIMQSS